MGTRDEYLVDLEAANTQLSDDNKALKARIAELEAERDTAILNRSNMGMQLSEAKARIAELEAKLASAKDGSIFDKMRIKDRGVAAFKRLREQVKKLEAERDAGKWMVDRYNKELDETRALLDDMAEALKSFRDRENYKYRGLTGIACSCGCPDCVKARKALDRYDKLVSGETKSDSQEDDFLDAIDRSEPRNEAEELLKQLADWVNRGKVVIVPSGPFTNENNTPSDLQVWGKKVAQLLGQKG